MKINNSRVVAGIVCVVATAMPVFAQLDEEIEATEPVVADQVVESAADKTDKGFDLLVRAVVVRGAVEVMNPDVGTFAPAQRNKAYPLGSVFRTGGDGSAVLAFSATERVELLANTEVVAAVAEKDPKARSVRLSAGKIKTALKDTLLDGQFSVETPNATCKNMAGRANITLTMEGENENFQIAVITGQVRLEGPQYTVEALRAANTVNVLTSPGRSLSRLTSVSGDYKITLDNGTEEAVVYDMSPKALVKIWREVAAVGGRMVVSTLVVSPTGTARHRFVYVEGRENIRTGELVEPSIELEPELAALLKVDEKKPAEQATETGDDDPLAADDDF